MCFNETDLLNILTCSPGCNYWLMGPPNMCTITQCVYRSPSRKKRRPADVNLFQKESNGKWHQHLYPIFCNVEFILESMHWYNGLVHQCIVEISKLIKILNMNICRDIEAEWIFCCTHQSAYFTFFPQKTSRVIH